MKNLINIFSVAGLAMLMTLSSCNLVDTNIDPTRQSDVNLSLIMPSMISQAAYNQTGNPARISGIVMQQFEGFDAQQVAYTQYNIPEITFNNYWRTGLYAGVLKDCKSIIDKAAAEGQPYYEGIAKIIQANEYGMATSMFGDIPFSQALQGIDNLKPGYDTQEQVYAGVQSLLDDGIALMRQASVAGGPAADDLIFGGDADSWIATANAMKARYHIHLTKVNGASAAQSALSALGSAFTSAAGQPDFTYEDNQIGNNPLAKFGIERPNTLIMDPGFVQTLIDRNDPRFSAYVHTDSQSFHSGANPNLVWAQNNSSIPLISYVELKFIEAEALLWTGASDADVEAALQAGITASMEANGVADFATYLADNGSLTGLTTTEEKLEKIMMEAYYAYYGIAFQQTWTNFRRNGYPNLTPNVNGTGGLNPSGGVPVRWLYPSSENQLNQASWEAAVANQGADLLDTDLWAFR